MNTAPLDTTPEQEEYHCVACELPDSAGNMVQCDGCDDWYHQTCAGVTGSISARDWTCTNCTTAISVASHSTTSTSRARRLALKLQQLNEQRALEKRFIEEKYKILQEEVKGSDGERSVRSGLSRRTSKEHVEKWVQQLPVQEEGALGSNQTDQVAATLPGTNDAIPAKLTGTSFDNEVAKEQVEDAHLNQFSQPATTVQGTSTPLLEQIPASEQISSKPQNPVELQQRRKQQQQQQQQEAKYQRLREELQRADQKLMEQRQLCQQQQQDKLKEQREHQLKLRQVEENRRQQLKQQERQHRKQQQQIEEGKGAIPKQDPNHGMSTIHPAGNSADRKPPHPGKLYTTNQLNFTENHPESNSTKYAPLQSLLDQIGLSPSETANLPLNLSQYTPSPSQIAARQVMPRDLPTFSGSPADWPVFISNFTNTTLACGYSPAENLIRLQRCLKGAALDAVRSRLLLPQSVPHIIETLRLLYGRPELLINALLDKVRSTPAPKAEKLESLIDFGMVVQSLCDHLEAANQQAHLSNPSLLIELVDKLPAHVKMEWATFMERFAEVNLKTFGEFMSGIVRSASRVTLYTGPNMKSDNQSKPRRGAVHSHTNEPQRSPAENDKPCLACNHRGHRLKDCGLFKSYNIDGRWRFVQDHGICRNCLNAHGRRPCRSSNNCGVDGCQFRHHPLLHSLRPAPFRMPPAENHIHRNIEHGLFFRILPVTLHGQGKSIQTFAFLDDGSSLTLIEDNLARQLGLDGKRQPLCLKWTGNMTRVENESRIVQMSVSNGDQPLLELRNARTVKALTLPQQSLNFKKLEERYNHLKGLSVSSYQNAVPRVLVGIDNLRLTVPLKTREGRIDEPVAVKTRLGWCIYGGSSNGRTVSSLNYHHCECTADQTLHNMVKDYFALEDVGAKSVVSATLWSDEEERALKILEETTIRVGEHFETGLLWRYDVFEFPDSYRMALKRLECLERRMNRNPKLRENLMKQMEDYQKKGYAHRATEAELMEADPRRVWYLPIGAVINPKKPDKVRMIWDAAAQVGGMSLNTVLLKGPDQLTSLPMVLFRFRQYQVAVSGDIQEMFHQIAICKQDRHAQRFLWRSDPLHTPEILLMDVATFGSTCSPASAQFVKNKNAREFTEQYPRAVEGIIKNHYVDDFLDSFESEKEASEISAQVKQIHSSGGFNIRNWQSNSSAVLEGLGENASSKVRSLNLESEENFERVLGLLWLPKDDVLSFSTVMQQELQQLLSTGERPTKRQVLKCLMSFFDPLGLLAAFVLHGKILLQDIWRSGIQWDERVNDDIFERWRKWVDLFKYIENVKIPRCYFGGAKSSTYKKLELHIFVDASEEAYSAVAYFRTVDETGVAECALVAAKTKVAPLKPMSVPRLELQSAVLGTRLMQFVIEGHTVVITRRFLWTDSRVSLAWIGADPRRYKQYVKLRTGEIRSATNPDEWRWVPSKLNVADQATKWGKGPRFNPDSPWFKGPDFLKLPEGEWPQIVMSTPTTEEELRPVHTHHGIPISRPIVDFTRFSNYSRLQRAMGYVFRFLGNLRRRLRKEVAETDHLTQEELRQAEISLIKMAQWETFPDDLITLASIQQSPGTAVKQVDKTSVLYQLSPALDVHGIVRIDGRIVAAEKTPDTVKFPVILPKCHALTTLIIQYYHRKYRHANADTVVNEVRQLYYVPQLRTVVRNIVKGCNWCKIRRARPQIPRMAPLPYARLASFVRPFSYVGIDLFGPLLVKVGRSNVKRWVALFTCLTIRAVHVEVVYSLSTPSCVMSVRRFISRRGAPVEIHTDNGTNFQGANRVLEDQLKKIHEDMAATFTNTTTKWLFIPPSAPHMGGPWERMVRSIKTAMEATNIGEKLDDEALLTLVIEAEGMVNSRPLTYLPLESDEAEALTPNHFLMGSSNGVRQPAVESTDAVAALKNSWKQIQLQLDIFWRRWVREYLPTLTRRTKWFGEVRPIAVGDLVFIVDDGKRNGWVRGRVLKVMVGQDGRIRQAMVQAGSGAPIRRPVSRLALLDVAQVGKTEPGAPGGQCYGGENVANWAHCPSTDGKAPQTNCQKTTSEGERKKRERNVTRY